MPPSTARQQEKDRRRRPERTRTRSWSAPTASPPILPPRIAYHYNKLATRGFTRPACGAPTTTAMWPHEGRMDAIGGTQRPGRGPDADGQPDAERPAGAYVQADPAITPTCECPSTAPLPFNMTRPAAVDSIWTRPSRPRQPRLLGPSPTALSTNSRSLSGSTSVDPAPASSQPRSSATAMTLSSWASQRWAPMATLFCCLCPAACRWALPLWAVMSLTAARARRWGSRPTSKLPIPFKIKEGRDEPLEAALQYLASQQ